MKSRILFEQMIGRGTRKGEKHADKSHFVVFDCFDGTLLEFFKNCTGVTAEPPEKPTRTIEQLIEDIWANRDRDYNVRCLVRRLQRIDKEMSADARPLFASFGIADGDMGKYAAAGGRTEEGLHRGDERPATRRFRRCSLSTRSTTRSSATENE